MNKLTKVLAAIALTTVAPLSLCLTACSQEDMSAYDIAVQNGYEGTQEEWLESIKGEPGKDGSKIFSGNGAPSAELGAVGDYYFDKTNKTLYEKTADGWGEPTSLQGAQGAQGPQGQQGPQGNPGVAGRGISGVNLEVFGPSIIYEISYTDNTSESFAVLEDRAIKLSGEVYTTKTGLENLRTVYNYPTAEGVVQVAEEGVLVSHNYVANAKAVISDVKTNVYNKATSKIENYTEFDFEYENYYVPVLDFGEEVEVDEISFGSTTYTANQTMYLSVGNNSHIRSSVFKVEDNIFYIVAPVVALETSQYDYISVNGQMVDLDLEENELENFYLDDVRYQNGFAGYEYNNGAHYCLVNPSSNSTLFVMGIKDEDDNVIGQNEGYVALTKKESLFENSSKNSISFGFTEIAGNSDHIGDYYGLAFYPAGWQNASFNGEDQFQWNYTVYILNSDCSVVGRLDTQTFYLRKDNV